MWITKVSINHPVFATMVMVGLMVLGLFSYQKLGVEKMPNVEIPGLFISVQYPGTAPEAIETDITKPIEEAVNTVNGIKRILSSSYEGRSQTYIEFNLNVNMDRAVQDVRDKVASVRPGFPKNVKEPFISRFDGDNAQPVTTLGITSKSRSLRDLSTLTEQIIVKRLQGVPGVGKVDVGGTVARQILVELNPAKMTAMNVGVDEVVAAIQATNQDMPAGRISLDGFDKLVRIEGKLKDPRSFGKIIVARRFDNPVLLEQVADIIDGAREEASISRINGEPAINLNIVKIQDANIVDVGNAIKETVAELKKNLPEDVEIQTVFDSASEVKGSLDRVKSTIMEGAALTILIVFLFLHSWRSTIITGLTLPISVIATFIALHAFGFTLNFLTLMALSLCIGLLIDDAIVVRENIVRHFAMGKSHIQAARDGTNEIGLAVTATTLAIVAVFVPVAFMDGIIGRFFFQFGVTVAVAVLVSLFVSFTLDPMLSSIWQDPVESRFKYLPWLERLMQKIEIGIEALHVVYGRILESALRWRKTTLMFAFGLFIGSFFLLPFIGTDMMPDTDNGFIQLKFKTPVGSSLAYNNSKLLQVEAALREFKEIKTINTTVGSDGNRNESTVGLKLVDLKTTQRPSQKQIEQLIRRRLSSIPGADLSVGFDKPIYVAILGPDPDKLKEVVNHVMQKIAAIKGITELENSMTASNPSVTVKVNNELASDLGLSIQQIGTALRPFIEGDTTNHWLAPDGQNYEINVQLPKSGREKIADLADLSVASNRLTADGKVMMIPLRQVVEFIPSNSPQVIKRQNLQRRVGIYANVDGRTTGDVGTDVQKLVSTIQLPPGYSFDVGGQTKDMQDSFMSAVAALGIAVIFIYLVLASQFGSFLQPLAIMVSLPLSLIGVFSALLITGSTLNIFSIIGFIMLMGLVTKNAILLVDFTNQAQRHGATQHDALLEAGQVRLRPIMMTTLAMLFGMLPMAIGVGEGGELQAPMGRAVIGGIITSTLLTLVVVPVAYSYLDSWGKRALRIFKGKGHHDVVEVKSVVVTE
ncbi:efflux RND transporter permease subunit [Solimicrobium silvestre]|uniref:Cation/multidrug efflux pump n=1 Tax=Solimicrobium silvestre TaxID=2099400 RepID=A0A2S9H509_9BURK|nr:efflux RND transporter permease subunit [Solimicrobium silvestre]PRC95047.1 Cation/multidrug efflux pump [Solimicrobium silvestre]